MLSSLAYRLSSLREIVDHPLNRGDRLRAIGRYLAWNVGRRLVDTDYVMPLVNGGRVILSNRENYATLCYTCCLYDFPEMAFLLHFLREGDTFGDFGANVGVYSVLAATTRSAVIAAEPVPSTYAALQRNWQLNGCKGAALNVALGDAPGSLKFTSNLGGLNHVARATDTDVIEVPVSTVDEVTAGRPPRMAKIDVEGFEVPLLKGAAKLLAGGALEAVIIELNGSGNRFGYPDAMADGLLRQAGFRPFSYAAETRELSPLDTFNRTSFNTLYLREAALETISRRAKSAPTFSVRGRNF